jgi:3-hydroxyacyl-CoA dehydrogenase
MKWGFNWELGPFETWDAIGLVRSVEKMEAEGLAVPAWVKDWIAEGNTSFYKKDGGSLFQAAVGGYTPVELPPEQITLRDLKSQNKVVRSNSGASLIDLGDGVACLEFHSPNNAIGADILQMISQSMDEVRDNFEGLVIANQGRNFCVGANLMLLLMEAQDEEWDEVDDIIRLFQNTMYRLKRFEKPVIAAPHRMTLGGGVEACMPADQVIATAETYYGLVEVGVGLIPAGGGCKELALRASQQASIAEADIQPYLNHYFQTVGTATVSTSGHDAKRLGLLKPSDRVVLNPDHTIYEAKQAVLKLAGSGYEPIPETKFRVVGSEGKAVLQLGALGMHEGGYISDHDLLIANKLAHVLAGGDVPAGTYVTEQYMLDLEREAFLSLCGEPKTRQRMQHMLSKGKPLRN